MKRQDIINNILNFVNNKITEIGTTNPIILITRPIINRAVNNSMTKIDTVLKLIQDKDENIDIEGILTEMIDNLIVSNIKKYPDILGGIEIGEGAIKINLPIIDKAIVFDSKDIESFKESIINNN